MPSVIAKKQQIQKLHNELQDLPAINGQLQKIYANLQKAVSSTEELWLRLPHARKDHMPSLTASFHSPPPGLPDKRKVSSTGGESALKTEEKTEKKLEGQTSRKASLSAASIPTVSPTTMTTTTSTTTLLPPITLDKKKTDVATCVTAASAPASEADNTTADIDIEPGVEAQTGIPPGPDISITDLLKNNNTGASF